MTIGGTLLSLGVGYLFHLCFECRFMASETLGIFFRCEAPPLNTEAGRGSDTLMPSAS